jgi:hypothetical protein
MITSVLRPSLPSNFLLPIDRRELGILGILGSLAQGWRDPVFLDFLVFLYIPSLPSITTIRHWAERRPNGDIFACVTRRHRNGEQR